MAFIRTFYLLGMTSSIITTTISMNQIQQTLTCSCPVTDDPVCTSNGQYFPSECMVWCHNELQNDNLTVVDNSHCYEPMNGNDGQVQEIMENLCLFTRGYVERDHPRSCASNLPEFSIGRAFTCVEVESSYKPKHYFVLLIIVSILECIIVFFANYTRGKR